MINFDQLWPRWNINPDGVLHLGASEGQEREVYARHKVNKVIWVEAIPEVFEKLVNNMQPYAGHEAILMCVGEDEGREVVFNVSNNEAQSSSYLELGHHSIIHPTVNYVSNFKTTIRRLDKVFNHGSFKGKWLLNADLQGAELDAFKGMGTLLNDFEWVYTELNKKETYKGCALVEDIDAYLAEFGFIRVETGIWVADTWTDGLYIKRK